MADGSLRARENVPENSWRMRAYRLALDHVPPEGGNTLDINAVCCALCRELGALEVAVTLASLEPTDAVLGEANGGDTHLSDVEVTAAQGPAGEAVARRRPCLLPRLVEAFERWPGYVALAGERGVASVYAFPLGVRADPMGALTIYMAKTDALDEQQVRLARGAAELASGILLNDRPDVLQFNSAEWYNAREGRSEVYQAQGMVGVELQLALPEAIALMRAHAFATGMTLTEVASEIVQGRVSLRSDRS